MRNRLLSQADRCSVELVAPSVDFLLDDLVLRSITFLPTFVSLLNSTEVAFAREPDRQADVASPVRSGSGKLYLRGLKLGASDISFWLRRKTWGWLPCFREESGLVEIALDRGDGLEAEVDYALADEVDADGEDHRTGFIVVRKVTVHVRDADIRLTRSRHPILAWLLRPLARVALRQALPLILQDQIQQAVEALDQRAFHAYRDAQARQRDGSNLVEAVILALISPSPTEPIPDTKPLLEDVHVTGKGFVVDDPDTDVTLAVGAGPQLLPGHGGPEHGVFGSGSAGRIAEQADAAAKEVARGIDEAGDQAQRAGERVAAVVTDTRAQLEAAPDVAAASERRERARRGWRSSAFDL